MLETHLSLLPGDRCIVDVSRQYRATSATSGLIPHTSRCQAFRARAPSKRSYRPAELRNHVKPKNRPKAAPTAWRGSVQRTNRRARGKLIEHRCRIATFVVFHMLEKAC